MEKGKEKREENVVRSEEKGQRIECRVGRREGIRNRRGK